MAKLRYMAGMGDGDSGVGDPGAQAQLDAMTSAVAPPVGPISTSPTSAFMSNPFVASTGLTSTQLAIFGGGALVMLALLLPSGGGRRR